MKYYRTMEVLTFGLTHPSDLLKKLERDAEKLEYPPTQDDVFNFIVTAAVLGEWIKNYYQTEKDSITFGYNKNLGKWVLPPCFSEWITDISCFPNEHYWMEKCISDCLALCSHTSNAAKHFIWNDKGKVKRIGHGAVPANWADYFFASTDEDIYITYEGLSYGLKQIRGILIQFYKGLIPYLEEQRSGNRP